MNELIEQYREVAFEIIKTPLYWYRQHYKIPANDPRLDDTTEEEILLEFVCHSLYGKFKKLVEDGAENITLNDLLIEERFQEAVEAPPDKQEVLIDFHG